VRLHDDMEAVEEKRARYEEELDRVNDMLTESESRRQALQKEVDLLVEQVRAAFCFDIRPLFAAVFILHGVMTSLNSMCYRK